MNQNEDENNQDENNIEQPTPEVPEDQLVEEEEEKSPPSRLSRFFRKVLVWLIIVIVVFSAGFLIDHFLRYKPLSVAMTETQSELDQITQEVSDLRVENTRLTNEVDSLQEALAIANARLGYFQVLMDVNNARINLFLEEIQSAQEVLADTSQRLEDLLPFIAEVDDELALSLPRRLELIIAGLERDPETARIDLELFTKDLLELEPLLFGD